MTAPRLTGAEIVTRIYSPGRDEWTQPDPVEAKLAALVDAVEEFTEHSHSAYERLCHGQDVDAAYRALVEEAKR